MSKQGHILVIKLSALGDFVLSFAAFAAIRAHHPDANITLLTTPPYAELARRSPWFDDVRLDTRPKLFDLRGWLQLRAMLRGGNFSRVYDLQANDRTAFYGRLFWPSRIPKWCGTAPYATFRHLDADRLHLHSFDMRREQLRLAGIADTPLPDLAWLDADISHHHLPENFMLICAGASPQHPAKRWPAAGYAALCQHLLSRGITPVLIGAAAEKDINAEIARAAPGTRDLTGRTHLFDLAALARSAAGAVGNDTGPMHLIAAAGCPTLSLFSGVSQPWHSRPMGPKTTWLQRDNLEDLRADEVSNAMLLRE